MDTKFQAHYAALKILKQRCEHLQQRVDLVEEENCQLKLQRVQTQEKAVNNPSYNNCLEEQIILLNKQNDRMSNQIQIITTENKNLWSQLSTIISGDETLGNVLTVSTASDCKKDAKASELVSKFLDDCYKESLEEISLKLINGIVIGKSELESQYSPVIDLEKENNHLQSNHISKTTHFDCRAYVGAIKVLVQKMIDFRDALLQQKMDLSNAIKSMKNFSSNFSQNNILVSDSLNNLSNKGNVLDLSNTNFCLQDLKESHDESSSKPCKICPMCGKNFTENFNVFFDHVTSHFEEKDLFNIQMLK